MDEAYRQHGGAEQLFCRGLGARLHASLDGGPRSANKGVATDLDLPQASA